MKKQFICIFIIIVLLDNLQCFGQNVPDSTRIVRVETIDGNVFVGFVVTEDSSALVIKTETLGEIKIPQNNIKSKTELKEVKKVGSEFWLPNPQSSRYFWAPNGYGLEKGSSYYQNIWILYNQFSFGLSDNFSIGAGMVPLFLFGGTATPFWIVPKLSIPVVENKFNVGTGAFLGTIIGEQTGVFGLLYGTTTFGSRDKNLSFGLAYGFADGEWLKVPIINVSCLVRTGPKGYFISENYVISFDGEVVVLISAGGRSIIRNIGLDYSLWIPFGPQMDSFIAIPFIGITIPIARKK
jgi:RNase P/RNase MRP subunit p29